MSGESVDGLDSRLRGNDEERGGRVVADPVRRQLATAKTRDAYIGRAFAWKAGHTCVHMARFHLLAMGHKPPMMPGFRSAIGAKRALARNGWAGVEDMLDSMLPRVAPLQMRLGDLAAGPGLDGIGALFVCVPPFKLLGWHEDADEAVVIDFDRDALSGCWKV